MTSALLNKAETLAEKIRQEPAEARLALRPAFLHLLSELRIEGITIPRRLHQLDVELSDEETESQFDNMPV
ncbi:MULTISPECIES: hypothetical protein [unclassified Pseudophaeobacter]|uniref:hypothetical protein n=1 Tax=unclassified Pseudophaeobacter TaxID=2637024 RepID=UPI000EFCCCC1|nr:hypothetical protein [Pseudophaeobacter sp. EL27]